MIELIQTSDESDDYSKENNIIISIEQIEPCIKNLFNKHKRVDAQKYISYAIYISSLKSSGNIKGLSPDELHKEAIRKFELPIDFNPNEEIKDIITFIDTYYNVGIFGIIKELKRSLEITRKSLKAINDTNTFVQEELEESLILLKEKKANKEVVDRDSLKSIVTLASDILTASDKIKGFMSTLEQDVTRLKTLEELASKKDYKKIKAFGNATVPKSAM